MPDSNTYASDRTAVLQLTDRVAALETEVAALRRKVTALGPKVRSSSSCPQRQVQTISEHVDVRCRIENRRVPLSPISHAWWLGQQNVAASCLACPDAATTGFAVLVADARNHLDDGWLSLSAETAVEPDQIVS